MRLPTTPVDDKPPGTRKGRRSLTTVHDADFAR